MIPPVPPAWLGKVKPPKWTLFIPLGILLIGLFAGIPLLTNDSSLNNISVQPIANGESTLYLDTASYVMYFDSGTYTASDVKDITVQVRNADTGATVRVTPYTGNTVTIYSNSYASFVKFTASPAGNYTITATARNGVSPNLTVYLGKGLSTQVAIGFTLFGVGTWGAIILFIVFVAMRAHNRKKLLIQTQMALMYANPGAAYPPQYLQYPQAPPPSGPPGGQR